MDVNFKVSLYWNHISGGWIGLISPLPWKSHRKTQSKKDLVRTFSTFLLMLLGRKLWTFRKCPTVSWIGRAQPQGILGPQRGFGWDHPWWGGWAWSYRKGCLIVSALKALLCIWGKTLGQALALYNVLRKRLWNRRDKAELRVQDLEHHPTGSLLMAVMPMTLSAVLVSCLFWWKQMQRDVDALGMLIWFQIYTFLTQRGLRRCWK